MSKLNKVMNDVEQVAPDLFCVNAEDFNWLIKQAEKVEVYVIMFTDAIFRGEFFTEEKEIQKAVERLNVSSNSDNYWYRTLRKGD